MSRTARQVQPLDPAVTRRLSAQPLTYPEVGRSLGSDPAEGYRHLSQVHRLPPTTRFAEAVHALVSWQVQARSGLHVAASSAEVRHDALVVMRLGIAPLAVSIPCRVIAVVDEPRRRGFAYGTLPGHPEQGEEAFVLEHRTDGSIIFTITAFSRPATLLARLGGPVSTGVQRLMTQRYLRALDA